MRRVLLATVCFIALATIVVYGQQINSLTIGAFTINVPSTNPSVTVQSPNRSGTLALREDIPSVTPTPVPTPSGPTEQHGSISIVNGAGSVVLSGFSTTPKSCFVVDPSGNSVAYSFNSIVLNVKGVGPTVFYLCKQ